MDLLRDILKPARLTAVVDVGANPIEGEPPYKRMLEAGLCEVVGFEPQPEGLRCATANAGPLERYLPYAVGDGTPHTLHICSNEGMSSLKAPNPEQLALFNLFPEWGTVTARAPIATKRLDDITEIAQMDFLKMDVQGSELDVLTHGRNKLAETVVVQSEVSFITLYDGQPGFGEIDVMLRGLGFVPHCFAALKIWPLAPMIVSGQPNRGLRQLLEADLVYVRDFTRAGSMSAEQWKHLALVAHHCYGSVDLAARCLSMLAELGAVSGDARGRYLSSFARPDADTR